jgi:nucleotide-binding universal stress UspA family protein
MYKSILVPLDGSKVAEQVLPYTRFLSARLEVPVELVGVLDLAAIAASVDSHKARYLGVLVEDSRRASEAYLERIGKTFLGTPITCSVETGKPEEVIIAKRARDKKTLIAMATHGRSGMSRWLLGSVAEKVLRATTNPLLLVRARGEGSAEGEVKFERVIVPLDTSALAESVLPDVIDLAKALNLAVILMHAYVLPPWAYYGAGDYYNPRYKSFAAQLKEEARSYLESKVNKLKVRGLEKISSVLVEGSAAEEIIALARREPNSLVAMCTHGYSGVKHWVLGSVAEKVVRHSADPVLVIRAT